MVSCFHAGDSFVEVRGGLVLLLSSLYTTWYRDGTPVLGCSLNIQYRQEPLALVFEGK